MLKCLTSIQNWKHNFSNFVSYTYTLFNISNLQKILLRCLKGVGEQSTSEDQNKNYSSMHTHSLHYDLKSFLHFIFIKIFIFFLKTSIKLNLDSRKISLEFLKITSSSTSIQWDAIQRLILQLNPRKSLSKSIFYCACAVWNSKLDFLNSKLAFTF